MNEDMLLKAARSAAMKMNTELPEAAVCDHVFSDRFERKMKRLCSRVKHPVGSRILRCAVCALLALMISFASVLTVNAEVRDKVYSWIRKQYEAYFAYSSNADISGNTEARYYPGWLPEGYSLSEYDDNTGDNLGEHFTYRCALEGEIQFAWYPDTSFRKKYAASTLYELCEVLVNGVKADLYIAPTRNERSMLYWYDEMGVLLYVSGNDPDILIKIAENVVKK